MTLNHHVKQQDLRQIEPEKAIEFLSLLVLLYDCGRERSSEKSTKKDRYRYVWVPKKDVVSWVKPNPIIIATQKRHTIVYVRVHAFNQMVRRKQDDQ